MPDSTNTIVSRLCAYLRAQSFTPALREVIEGSHSPPSAYPCVQISAESGSFGPGGVARYTLLVRIATAAGRSTDALSSARSLAAQVQASLDRGGNLGGAARGLRVAAVRFGALGSGDPVTAWAELDVEADCILP